MIVSKMLGYSSDYNDYLMAAVTLTVIM